MHPNTIIEDNFSKLVGKVFAYVVLLDPILSIYGWGSMSLSLSGSIILIGIYLTRYKFRLSLPRPLCLLFVYLVINSIICSFYYLSFVPVNYIRLFLFYNAFFFLGDFEVFYKAYKNVAIVCIVFFLFQETSYFLLGHRMSGIFTFLPISLRADMADIQYNAMMGRRSSSFFSEPSHFGQFLLPILILTLFSKKKNIILPFLIILSLLLLRSGAGFIGVLLIVPSFLLSFVRRFKYIQYILLLFVIVLAYYFWEFYINTDIGGELFARTSILSGEKNIHADSDYSRLFRGYDVIGKENVFELLFGMTDNNVILDMIKRIGMESDFGGVVYFNGAQSVIIYSGLIGTTLFIVLFFRLFKNSCTAAKILIINFIVISFYASVFFSSIMFVTIFSCIKLKNENEVRNLFF